MSKTELGVRRKLVSTHSRLKAAGYLKGTDLLFLTVSTHSRLKAAGKALRIIKLNHGFQHTAA